MHRHYICKRALCGRLFHSRHIPQAWAVSVRVTRKAGVGFPTLRRHCIDGHPCRLRHNVWLLSPYPSRPCWYLVSSEPLAHAEGHIRLPLSHILAPALLEVPMPKRHGGREPSRNRSGSVGTMTPWRNRFAVTRDISRTGPMGIRDSFRLLHELAE